jgi:hypothetical protein
VRFRTSSDTALVHRMLHGCLVELTLPVVGNVRHGLPTVDLPRRALGGGASALVRHSPSQQS